jgi:hypothetical protein
MTLWVLRHADIDVAGFLYPRGEREFTLSVSGTKTTGSGFEKAQ